MSRDKSVLLAVDLSINAMRLIRWLRASDNAPALSGPEASAMSVIVHSGGLRPSDLAELEQVRRPTISRLVDGLVKRGLVSRSPDPADARASWLTVTEQGRRLWEAGQLRRVEPLAARIAKLPEEEIALLEAANDLLVRLASVSDD